VHRLRGRRGRVVGLLVVWLLLRIGLLLVLRIWLLVVAVPLLLRRHLREILRSRLQPRVKLPRPVSIWRRQWILLPLDIP
jgi:hypothetical protein